MRDTFLDDQPLLNSFIDPRAMPTGFPKMVLPRIAVSIEMDHRERLAEPGLVGPQQWQGNGVVTANPDHVMGTYQLTDLRHHGDAHRVQAGVG